MMGPATFSLRCLPLLQMLGEELDLLVVIARTEIDVGRGEVLIHRVDEVDIAALGVILRDVAREEHRAGLREVLAGLQAAAERVSTRQTMQCMVRVQHVKSALGPLPAPGSAQELCRALYRVFSHPCPRTSASQ